MDTVREPAKKNRNKEQRSIADPIFDILNYVFWIVVLFIILYPLYLVIIASVSSPDAVLNGRVTFWPVDFSLVGYEAIFAFKDLWTSYINAIVYMIVGTFISVIVTLMGAYVTSRSFIGKKFLSFFFVFAMFFNGGLIPTFLLMRDIGLYNTRAIMVLMGGVTVWNLMVARTYIQTSIPRELYEAAVVDGANHFTFFFKVVLPLSGTIIAVLCVYYGVSRWNDFFTGLVYIRDRFKLPLQTVLREILAAVQGSAALDTMIDRYGDGVEGILEAQRKVQVARYCCIVISTGPVIILYIFMQKYFVKGIMIGSLKA